MRENYYAISCIILKKSYVFSLQDEHNASYFSKMSCEPRTCNCKFIKIL